MTSIEIEGVAVRFEVIEGRRLWFCRCEYFQKRLESTDTTATGGYCPHIAVAALKCMRDGLIDPRDEVAGQFEKFIHAAANRSALPENVPQS